MSCLIPSLLSKRVLNCHAFLWVSVSRTGVFQRYIAVDRFDDSGAVLGESDKHAWRPPSANALASRTSDLGLRVSFFG